MWGWWCHWPLRAFPAPRQERTWEDALVGPSVHKVTLLGRPILKEQEAGDGGTDVSRH
jgi:hypothetical protein